MTERDNGSLYTRISDGIATLEFGHPAGNSFPAVLLERLHHELDRLSEEDQVRIIVLRSEGEKAFCAGASFDELLAVGDLEEGKQFFSGFANVINAMKKCRKLIIGRIHGKTVGGGVGLAAACDYCFATVQAAVRLSELSIGIGPFVIAPAVRRKMGVAALSELCLAPKEWKPEYGGALVLYPQKNGAEEEVTLFPYPGRMIIFESQILEHEVKPVKKPRLSITGWLKTR